MHLAATVHINVQQCNYNALMLDLDPLLHPICKSQDMMDQCPMLIKKCILIELITNTTNGDQCRSILLNFSQCFSMLINAGIDRH